EDGNGKGNGSSPEAELESGAPRQLWGIPRDEVKSGRPYDENICVRREHLRQMSDAEQFQHARCHVGEFKDARPLLDCGHLEANQRSEARAIQMFYIRKVDNDATARKNDGPHQFFYLTCGVTD